MTSRILLLLSGLLGLLPLLAHGARPFVTDDARLTTAGSCQLESWTRLYPQSRELWLLPACNPGGNLEITAGMGAARGDGQSRSNDYVLQAKTLFKALETNDWGWGLAVGQVSHPSINPGPNLLGNTYAYVPVSVSLLDDRLVLHGNLGWLRDKASRQHRLTWGVGGELAIDSRSSVIAEMFGDDRERPLWQTGIRFFVVPERVQVDATVGRQLDGGRDGQWFSLGLRLTPARMF